MRVLVSLSLIAFVVSVLSIVTTVRAAPGDFDLNGTTLILDQDQNTTLVTSVDDVLTFNIGGATEFVINASGISTVGGFTANLNLNNNDLINIGVAGTDLTSTTFGLAVPIEFSAANQIRWIGTDPDSYSSVNLETSAHIWKAAGLSTVVDNTAEAFATIIIQNGNQSGTVKVLYNVHTASGSRYCGGEFIFVFARRATIGTVHTTIEHITEQCVTSFDSETLTVVPSITITGPTGGVQNILLRVLMDSDDNVSATFVWSAELIAYDSSVTDLIINETE